MIASFFTKCDGGLVGRLKLGVGLAGGRFEDTLAAGEAANAVSYLFEGLVIGTCFLKADGGRGGSHGALGVWSSLRKFGGSGSEEGWVGWGVDGGASTEVL